MARIRTIKPEFFTSEDIVALSPLARLLFIAVWCEADKEGRLRWKPKTMRLRYFPADDCDIEALASELIDAGLVVLYGDGLAHVPGFTRHQHVNPRESSSVLPDPAGESAEVSGKTPRVPTRADASIPDLHCDDTVSDAQGGREGKGTNKPPKPPGGGMEGFDDFWSRYPKKRNRGDAEKAWVKLKPTADLLDRVLRAVEVAKQRDDWRKNDGQFVPYPASWLNAKGWEDEAPVQLRCVSWQHESHFAGAK